MINKNKLTILDYNQKHDNQIKTLLDEAYPKEPRDVFMKFKKGFDNAMCTKLIFDKNILIGIGTIIKTSKGGYIENTSELSKYQGNGIGTLIVKELLKETKGLIMLTTRKMEFYESLGFSEFYKLPDGSTAMYLWNV